MFRLTDDPSVLWYYIEFQYVKTGSNCFGKSVCAKVLYIIHIIPRKNFETK